MQHIVITPIKAPRHKNKYQIDVKFMHGDADAYSTESYLCKDEAEFVKIMSRSYDWPESPGGGGDEDEYDQFCEEMFGDDFVPGDCTCDCQVKAAFESFTGYYYDHDGTKFFAKLGK